MSVIALSYRVELKTIWYKPKFHQCSTNLIVRNRINLRIDIPTLIQLLVSKLTEVLSKNCSCSRWVRTEGLHRTEKGCCLWRTTKTKNPKSLATLVLVRVVSLIPEGMAGNQSKQDLNLSITRRVKGSIWFKSSNPQLNYQGQWARILTQK